MDSAGPGPFTVQGESVREIPWFAAEQCGVFAYDQAVAAGWTRGALQHATKTGGLVRLRVGVYQRSDLADLDPFQQARWRHAAPGIAAALAIPGAQASHSTAAVLRGLPLLFIPQCACATVVPWHTGEIPRVHVHRCTSGPMSLPVGRVPCLSAERTAIDIAREHGVVAGVVALDHLLHERPDAATKLSEELRRCVRWPGVRAAREAVALADADSESPLETRSRLKFSAVGIPPPELQVRIGSGSGQFLGRVDFYWDEFGVVGEADGAVKYDDEGMPVLYGEKLRQELLEDTGLYVVRWGSPDLGQFEAVANRIARGFARGARRPEADRRWTILPRLPRL